MVHLSGGHNASGYGFVYGYVYDYEYSCGFGYEWVATMHPCTGTSERTFLVMIIIIVRSIEMVRRAKQRSGHSDPYTDAL